MRNKHNSFYRTDEIGRESNKRVDWLDQLAEKMAVEEQATKFPQVKTASSKTAVEVARERHSQPSIYEMMSAIVSGQKPKFSSVEEAVKDYQERTGLSEYLKAQTDDQRRAALASVIVNAGGVDESDESTDEEVNHAHDGDTECAECGDMGVPDLDMLFDLKKKLLTEPDVALVEWNPKEQQLEAKANEEEKPELVAKNPAIENFITNMIDTNHGIQVPALIHSLVETFARDGVSKDVVFDNDFLQWINKLLIGKSSVREYTPSQIGRGVGTQIDYSGEKDSNRDPFTLLVPDKGMF